MVYDFAEVSRLYHLWERGLPGVRPYYAVKCHTDEHLLSHLNDLGAGFDCASPAEIDMVLRHTSAAAGDILYANPMKAPADLQYAAARGVPTTVVDSIYEIDKLATLTDTHPQMNALIRIYANDPAAKCPLSHKYGALPDEWAALLDRAQSKGVSLVGISFHVGSGAKSPAAFEEALTQATALHRLAASVGIHLDLLDLGGGFTLHNFKKVSQTLRHRLPTTPFQRIIAEPGRFFTETMATLYTPIHGRRDRHDHRDYYISDSIYGSFNALLYDHLEPTVVPLSLASSPSPLTPRLKQTPSTIYGSTCDGLDVILKNTLLPELQVGDWLQWPNMGAYTLAGASLFNGFPFPFIPKFYK